MDAYLLPLIVLTVAGLAGAPIFIAAVVLERKLRSIHKQLISIAEYIEEP